MEDRKLSISNHAAISAIYFALLQCGYDFYGINRDAATVSRLNRFVLPHSGEYDFFSEVRQNTCEVYPYWPRAAMLEAAAFYIDFDRECFANFDAYKSSILSSANLLDTERNQAFWNWIDSFPQALSHVLQSKPFRSYFEWENVWIAEQNEKYHIDLEKMGGILYLCRDKFHSPFQSIQVVLNPIKCALSADYHTKEDTFIFCSGAFSPESVIHEWIHHFVHPVVENKKNEILRCCLTNLGLDNSYYLNGGEAGYLNAFEEYTVRKLTDQIWNGIVPDHLDGFLDDEMMNLRM